MVVKQIRIICEANCGAIYAQKNDGYGKYVVTAQNNTMTDSLTSAKERMMMDIQNVE